MKGNKSKLIEKTDIGITTSSQLSIPMDDLRYKNPQNYLQLALKMSSDFYYSRFITQGKFYIELLFSKDISTETKILALALSPLFYAALRKLPLFCLNFPV